MPFDANQHLVPGNIAPRLEVPAHITRPPYVGLDAPPAYTGDNTYTEAEIDKIFLTGGTSFVPAVRRMFETRFGASRLETGEQLLSIAYGLALIGGEEDIARWTVREAVAAA